MELVSLENLEEKKRGGGSYLGYIDTKRYRGMRKKDRKIRGRGGEEEGEEGEPCQPLKDIPRDP